MTAMPTELLPGEEWRKIRGSERYSVSSLGRVFAGTWKTRLASGKERRLGPRFMGRVMSIGYRSVNILGGDIYIHRLVAEAFIPNPLDKPQVNHLNGDKADNRAINLEWTTSSENHKHSFRELGRTTKPLPGESNPFAKLTRIEAMEIFRLEGKASSSSVALKYNISDTTVQSIWNGRCWGSVTGAKRRNRMNDKRCYTKIT